MKRIKTLRTYTALARLVSELSDEPVGYIPRANIFVNTPYAYTPAVAVYGYQGKKVYWLETAHRKYEVFEVTDERVYNTEEDATDANESIRDHMEDLRTAGW